MVLKDTKDLQQIVDDKIYDTSKAIEMAIGANDHTRDDSTCEICGEKSTVIERLYCQKPKYSSVLDWFVRKDDTIKAMDNSEVLKWLNENHITSPREIRKLKTALSGNKLGYNDSPLTELGN